GALVGRLAGRRGLLACDLALAAGTRHLVDAEGGHHLAQHGIGRRVAVLELAEVRLDLGLDEAAERLADQLVLLAPLDHAALPRSALRRQDGARLSLHAEQALLGEDRREPPALEPLERGRLLA